MPWRRSEGPACITATGLAQVCHCMSSVSSHGHISSEDSAQLTTLWRRIRKPVPAHVFMLCVRWLPSVVGQARGIIVDQNPFFGSRS